jgi:hypothetical protein
MRSSTKQSNSLHQQI